MSATAHRSHTTCMHSPHKALTAGSFQAHKAWQGKRFFITRYRL